VKYLETELEKRRSPEVEVGEHFGAEHEELIEAREMIRWLNSHNSELRSQLEVLSGVTREGSHSRESGESGLSEGADTNQDSASSITDSLQVKNDYADLSSSTDTTESFVEVESVAKSAPGSGFTDTLDEETGVEVGEDTVLEDRCIGEGTFLENNSFESLKNPEAMRALEGRFLAAMEQLARLSGDKERLEHLVERLQGETDTIGDYVIMYQQQRTRHKDRIREKEQQVAQLASDRAELQDKLSQLQDLVTKLVSKNAEAENKENIKEIVSNISEDEIKEKEIMQLLSEIGTDSNQIMKTCEKFEPWFWENSPSKVLEV